DAGQSEAASHDGAHADARTTRDAGSSNDAGGACGGEVCYAGETCADGGCQLSGCNGVTVPGDYATVQSAVNAFTIGTSHPGGTICLGAGTFDEAVTVGSPYGGTY